MNFAELRRKAEEAANSARNAVPSSSKGSRYEPVRPTLGPAKSAERYPSQAERTRQSTVLNWEQSKHVAPAPPRRLPSASNNAYGASPALEHEADALQRPTPAPPYRYAVEHDLPSPASPVLPRETAPPQRASLDPPRDAAPVFKRFSDYTDGDKRDLFDVLDSFFDSRLDVVVVGKPASGEAPEPPSRRQQAHSAPYLPPASPPPVARSTRPRLAESSSSSSAPTPQPYAPTPKPRELHAPSYPPPSSHSSAALSLLHYLIHAPFSTAWFASLSSPLPPPLVGRSDVRFTASFSQRGTHKALVGCALFGDASTAWWRLSWDAASEQRGTAHADVAREARYRPAPDLAGPEWTAERLYAASERYGVRVARFAEEARKGGVPVARGECWDVASEALKAVEADEAARGPRAARRPLLSVGRTHGALLYYANAGAEGKRDADGRVVGTWKGGDVYVRPGDVVEWRQVRISEVGARQGAYMMLGDPDHTAVVTSVSPPHATPSIASSAPYLDAAYPLASLNAITVVEQSLGYAPTSRTYDLGSMSAGELWIYRPCGMQELCGYEEVSPQWPEEQGVQCWSVGELGD
ncbi:hypothetical protein Rhopal_003269-T1 [Rhodotorula paludigena]|uniref:BBC1/AIM3 cysteine proteinase-fold domain-containing protein n=1 Tax=Rhodotorula paludigena TaxID=86838 RepID=A0AAV5GJ79_9BASI|nr:hypothetical protein Rhopal_003269-T1 [Rhodotorula paludigena]